LLQNYLLERRLPQNKYK